MCVHKDLQEITLFQAALVRFKALRLTVSHTYLNKKMEEFGRDHNKLLLELKEKEEQILKKNNPELLVKDPAQNEVHTAQASNDSTDLSALSKKLLDERLKLIPDIAPIDDNKFSLCIPQMKAMAGNFVCLNFEKF